MRKRLLPAALGLAVLISGSVALTAPAHATPTPVSLNEPGAAYATQGNGSPSGSLALAGWAVSYTRFVAQSTGPLRTIEANVTTTGTATVALSDGDAFSPPRGGGATTGATLSTASMPAGGTMGATPWTAGSFDTPVAIVKGHSYVLKFTGSVGDFRVVNGGAGYWADNGNGGTSGTNSGASFAVNVLVGLPIEASTTTAASADGAHGWFKSPTQVHYSCVAGAIAPADCPVTATPGDGSHHLTGSTQLVGGGTFDWTYDIKQDATPPTIAGTATPTAQGMKVTWTCTDATSGIDVCPAPTYVSGVGSDTVATAQAKDLAGNTATDTVTGIVGRKNAPALTITGVAQNATYAYGTTVTPKCTATSTLPASLRTSVAAPAVATCTGTSTSTTNRNGSVTWTYTATAVDSNPLGGTTTASVSWTIAAKPVAAPAAPAFAVKGLPSKTKNGYPVIDHKKKYKVSFVFKDKNGKTLTGKPTWLHSVVTNKAGTKGTPTTELVKFTKVKGVWTMTFTPGYDYAGHYRKFGVVGPDGKRHYVVIYVK